MRGTILPISMLLTGSLFHPAESRAQGASPAAPGTAVIEQLFAAMRSSDTAVIRTLFLANARVIPLPAATALSVDQFVAFAGRNAPDTWIERIWSPVIKQTGPLADLWFEYDVYKGKAFAQCGVNSVQLVETGGGWRIVTMTFTASQTGCPEHPAPT